MSNKHSDNWPAQPRQRLADEVRRFDSEMRRLADLGINLHQPPRELLRDLRARREEMRRQHERLAATQQEADRLLLADLLDLYINGDDADREWLRDLLRQCRTFRWGFGWELATAIAGPDGARRALAVFSMKDGGSDWRDELLALDRLCVAMRDAGLQVATLLSEAAAWSSGVQRFPLARSTRALLLDYAGRLDEHSSPTGK